MKKSKLLHVVLAVVFAFSLVLPCFASTPAAPEGYRYQRGLLVNEKISYAAIESMDSSMLNELMGGGPIESYTVQNFSIDENTGAVQRSLSASASDFSVGISAQRIYEKGSAYDNFKLLAACYYFTDLASFMTDVLAIAWSDEFTLYEDYAFETRETYTGSGVYKDIYNSPALSPNTYNAEIGFSYNYDMSNLSTSPHSVFIVGKVYKLDSSGTANVTAEYAHAIIDCDVSVSFSIPAGISFSPSAAQGIIKASPNYTNFNY